jgi:hypothetical protein
MWRRRTWELFLGVAVELAEEVRVVGDGQGAHAGLLDLALHLGVRIQALVERGQAEHLLLDYLVQKVPPARLVGQHGLVLGRQVGDALLQVVDGERYAVYPGYGAVVLGLRRKAHGQDRENGTDEDCSFHNVTSPMTGFFGVSFHRNHRGRPRWPPRFA